MAELLLGFDVGTSSSKGCLVRPGGEVVARAERAHEVTRPHPGWVESDPEKVWWDDFVAICRELLDGADDEVAAVGCSGMGPCLVAAGADGRPLRPAILYGIDSRASREIIELTERYGADAILARGGSPLTTQAVGPKLLWLRRNEPEVWSKTIFFFTVSSYLVHRLTGEYVLDHHSASRCDPLYDMSANAWIDEWCEEVAPGLDWPSLLWSTEIAGSVTGEAAAATGLKAGTPVTAGTMDTWAEAASVDVQEPGDMMLMYGTTMFLIEVASEARSHPKLWSTVSFSPGTHNLAGGMATSGAIAQWFRKIASDPDWQVLEDEASAAPPGANGLVVLPYFSGERAPLFDPKARGVIFGLTLGHGRGHIYRALLEGTGYGVRHMLDTMKEAGGGAGPTLVAVGGGTKGPLWPQLVSDITGRAQQLPTETIGASAGDAFLAAVGIGVAQPNDRWNAIGATVTPNASARSTYDELYSIYRDLYTDTRIQAHALAELQTGE